LLELLLLWAARVLPRAATLGACYLHPFKTDKSNILYDLSILRSTDLYIVIYFFTMSKNSAYDAGRPVAQASCFYHRFF